jgi:sulfite exporter TauE/SafE
MIYLMGLWESVRDFIGTGGFVLYFVAAALLIMWALMIERWWFLTVEYPKISKKLLLSGMHELTLPHGVHIESVKHGFLRHPSY